MRFAFFGTPIIAKYVLEELATAGFLPALLVTNPDALVGRKHLLTPSPVKVWATEHQLPVLQPTSLKSPDSLTELTAGDWDFFIVAAYGKLIPAWLLKIPKHGTLNVHPSLLPRLRGASPIRSAILEDERETGVTIMLMDEELDHGPIIAQEKLAIAETDWPLRGRELDERLARPGGRLLASTLPRYLAGELTPIPQDHSDATFCTKISKEMGKLTLDPRALPTGARAYDYLLKVRAFDGWPETFFIHHGQRIKIKDAELIDGVFTPTRVVPEGKTEIPFSLFIASQ
jgi:methionyl-tRNA formyltransferase